MHRRAHLVGLLPLLIVMSGCAGGGAGYDRNINPPSPPPSTSPPPQPGSLQFAASSLSVDETAGVATITITRTQGTDGAVSVVITSSDDSATAGQDYTPLGTTVTFPSGSADAQTVAVAITNDGEVEANETVIPALSPPTGGADLGPIATATLTIHDDEELAQPVLRLRSDIKQLKVSWESVPGASTYRLLRNPDGKFLSGFTLLSELPAGATSLTLPIAVHEHDWVNALYVVEACNAARGECSASNPATALNAMLQAIGYFKASNTDAKDEFGSSVSVSADGSTIVVGASGEDSNARGIGGDEGNNEADGSGAVYVFTRDAAGVWVQEAYVKASNTGGATFTQLPPVFEFGDGFGSRVALSGDGNTLAVAALREDSNAVGVGGDMLAQNNNDARNAGAVYVFARGPDRVWTQQAYVKASNTDAGDNFGVSLSLSHDGSTLAVGADREESNAIGVGGGQGAQSNDDAFNAGAVYVFTRSGDNVWSQPVYVKASNTQAGDAFGAAVALSADGTTLAVGAVRESSSAVGVGGNQSSNDFAASGAVYVFTRSLDGVWSQQAYVKASNTGSGDNFGSSLDLSADGSTLAVAAEREGSNSIGVGGDVIAQSNDEAPASGAVYVFTRSADAIWSQQAYVKASNTEADDLFGFSLALSQAGNTLAVAALREDGSGIGLAGDEAVTQNDNATSNAGAVYVFIRSEDAIWSQTAYVKAPGSDISPAEDGFGTSVDLSADGSTLVTGTPREDGDAFGVGGDDAPPSGVSAVDSGAVYLY